jgi:hypothetical protein
MAEPRYHVFIITPDGEPAVVNTLPTKEAAAKFIGNTLKGYPQDELDQVSVIVILGEIVPVKLNSVNTVIDFMDSQYIVDKAGDVAQLK